MSKHDNSYVKAQAFLFESPSFYVKAQVALVRLLWITFDAISSKVHFFGANYLGFDRFNLSFAIGATEF